MKYVRNDFYLLLPAVSQPENKKNKTRQNESDKKIIYIKILARQ